MVQHRRLPFAYYHPDPRDGLTALVARFNPDTVADAATTLARDIADHAKRPGVVASGSEPVKLNHHQEDQDRLDRYHAEAYMLGQTAMSSDRVQAINEARARSDGES